MESPWCLNLNVLGIVNGNLYLAMMNNNKIVFYINFFTICAFLVLCLSLYNAPICFMDDLDEISYIGHQNFFQLFGLDAHCFFRPVKNVLFYIFMLDKSWGLVYARIISFIISFCAYLSVKQLLSKLTCSKLAGSVGGAFWLLAPTMLSSVAWFSCTNIMVMALTGSCALLYYMKYKESCSHRKLFLFMTCILLFINMVSYEGGVALLPMIFALDFFMYHDDLKSKKLWRDYIYLVGTTLLYLFVRHFVTLHLLNLQNGSIGEEVSDLQMIFTSAWFAMHHVLLWFLPSNSQYICGCYYWGDVSVYTIAMCWSVIVLLSVFALLERKRCPLVSLSIAWCLLGVLPMSNLLAFRNGPYADYYLHYLSIGIVLLIAYLVVQIEKCGKKKYIGYGCLCCYMAYLFSTTISWIPAWKNSIFMIENTLTVFPKHIAMLYIQGDYYMKVGDNKRAQSIFGIIEGTSKTEKAAEAYKLWMEGKHQESFDLLDKEESLTSSTSKWSLYFRGYLLGECLENDSKAIEFYERAISYDNKSDSIWQQSVDQLAITYARNGRTNDAVGLWKSILPFCETPEEIQAKIDFVKKHIKQK